MRSAADWRKARVTEIERAADDVRAVTFAVEGDLPPFDPGSHTMIRVTIKGMRALRTYSMIPSPAGTLRIAVKLHENSRGGSAFIWSLKPGDETEMTAPENRFELSWRAPHYLLMAGGIGITPVYGMARALGARGVSMRVVYGARSRGLMAFAGEMKAALGDRLATFAQDEGGHIDIDAEIAALPAEGELYVCGPIRMLNAVKAAWSAAGRPVTRLRYEVFGDSGLYEEKPFRVEIPALNAIVDVRSDQSLLQALEEAGVDTISDCTRGECGLCAVKIISCDTEIDHRDVFFSEAQKKENHAMCACVSRLVGGSAVIDIGYRG